MYRKKRNRTIPLLLLTAMVLTALGCQKAEEPIEKTVPTEALATTYQTEVTQLLEETLMEETEPTKPVYQIDDPNGPAPMPNPECYGEVENPADLQWLLEEAQELLEGQELYFSTDVELLPNSTVHYYFDDTILAILWKQKVENTAFTFAEVKLMHPSQFRRHLSGGSFGSGTLALTSEMSQGVNAVVGCSGDYYSYRRRGLTIVDGKAEKYVPGLPDTCYINGEGDLILERDQVFSDLEEVQAYADENNIQFSLSFGPILVKDGENICPKGYDLGEVKERYSRAAICQMDKLHYLLVTANADSWYEAVPTIHTFAKNVASFDVEKAYALDGGQTAVIAMNGKLINRVVYGYQRRISDIIYFATAVPDGE
jgi:exopolysaccharide biosynthesis protein